MIRVKPIDRSMIDGWFIAESGLPPRVVHSCDAAGLRQVGELRRMDESRQRAMPGMGAACVRQIDQFMSISQRIESGSHSYADFQALLEDFLKPAQREVLELRYKLCSPASSESQDPVTLQAVGNRRQVSRERIRQVEKTALATLSRQLAGSCMAEVYDFFGEALKANGGMAETREVDALPDPGFFGAYRPAGILSLLCDCRPRFTARPEFFAAFPSDILERMENQILRVLAAGGQALPIARLVGDIAPVPGFEDPAAHRHIVGFVLRHMPGLSLTGDDYCFTEEAGAAVIMTQLMRNLPSPIHFRTLQEAFNTRIVIGKRQGAGYMLEVLRHQPSFVCTGSGYYAIRDHAPAPAGSPVSPGDAPP